MYFYHHVNQQLGTTTRNSCPASKSPKHHSPHPTYVFNTSRGSAWSTGNLVLTSETTPAGLVPSPKIDPQRSACFRYSTWVLERTRGAFRAMKAVSMCPIEIPSGPVSTVTPRIVLKGNRLTTHLSHDITRNWVSQSEMETPSNREWAFNSRSIRVAIPFSPVGFFNHQLCNPAHAIILTEEIRAFSILFVADVVPGGDVKRVA